MTTEPTPKPRKARTDCYIVRLVIRVPIDMADASTLSGAIKAVADLAGHLPEGSTMEHTTKPTFGKM